MASSGLPFPFRLPLSTPQSPITRAQQRPEVKQTTSDSKLDAGRPNIILSGASTPSRQIAIPPISGILSSVTSNTQIHVPDTVLSRDAVYAEAFNAATQALQQEEKPKPVRDKFKTTIRRALLRKFVLRMLIGKGPADFVYPWLHPKARAGGLSTV